MSYKKENLTPREQRQRRVRRKVRGTTERPRLCVFRSNKHIYVQAIDDSTGATIAQASSLDKGYAKPADEKGKVGQAKTVGKLIAERLLTQQHKAVVFDRNGFLYHGRIKAVADAAREAGLEF
ncbi:MAG: 50S ribosomal protein L18 [Myxococcales bacterium]|nr:50S ribosomal protein L18 [Myxococcales bacterium]